MRRGDRASNWTDRVQHSVRSSIGGGIRTPFVHMAPDGAPGRQRRLRRPIRDPGCSSATPLLGDARPVRQPRLRPAHRSGDLCGDPHLHARRPWLAPALGLAARLALVPAQPDRRRGLDARRKRVAARPVEQLGQPGVSGRRRTWCSSPALLLFPRALRSRHDAVKLGLDAAIMLVGGGMLVWHLVIAPTARSR